MIEESSIRTLSSARMRSSTTVSWHLISRTAQLNTMCTQVGQGRIDSLWGFMWMLLWSLGVAVLSSSNERWWNCSRWVPGAPVILFGYWGEATEKGVNIGQGPREHMQPKLLARSGMEGWNAYVVPMVKLPKLCNTSKQTSPVNAIEYRCWRTPVFGEHSARSCLPTRWGLWAGSWRSQMRTIMHHWNIYYVMGQERWVFCSEGGSWSWCLVGFMDCLI